MIKKLTVNLVSGTLSEFDSDTTLGIFCWRLKNALGEEKLLNFIDHYKNRNPVFTISNALFEIYDNLFFPQPVYIPSQIERSNIKKENIISMIKIKENKSIKYISLRRLNAFIKGDLIEYYNHDSPLYEKEKNKFILTPGFDSELRVGVQIDRESLNSSDGKLFSYHPRYLKKENKLVFLIKVLDDKAYLDFQCENILKDVFNVGYGKKKSSGFGQCEVVGDIIGFNDIQEPTDSNGFVTLGNFLPSVNDEIIEGKYDTKVKYGRLGEELSLSNNPFKNPILFITQGSYFKTKETKNHYGRITENSEISSSNPFAVQFGIPFTLNCKAELM